MIKCLPNVAAVRTKNAKIFRQIFRRKHFKNHNIGPWTNRDWICSPINFCARSFGKIPGQENRSKFFLLKSFGCDKIATARGLPDGCILSYQKSEFGYILEHLGMENVGIFYCNLEYCTANWYTYFMAILVKFVVIWYISPSFGMFYQRQIWQRWS
jgi:hypothetical protein